MSGRGWVSLHREIQGHWLWDDKPFAKGQAFTDLVMLANHKNCKFVFNGELIEVERGSFITSELKLMERWGWSKSKVRTFLRMLENDSMIIKKADNRKTTLSIVNYSDYQNSETTEGQVKDHRKTTEGLPKDTNNNENNENNEKKVYTPSFEDFYNIYPNSDRKAQTFLNYKKVIKKHDHEIILKAAKNYKNSLDENIDKKYIIKSVNFLGDEERYLEFIPSTDEVRPKLERKQIVILNAEDQEERFKQMDIERLENLQLKQEKRRGKAL